LPYVALQIKFTLEDIYEVLKSTKSKKFAYTKNVEKGLFFDEIDMKLYEPVSRLVNLVQRPKEEVEYISKLIIKEILYILIINEKSGYFLNKFAMEGTVSNKIVNAIVEIKNSFNEKLNIKELAHKIDMSESSFYQYFKTITSMSPIQFQKKLRLEEAKKMLETQNIEASEVAFNVGYESPSQFSREYSRMFGMSPKAHSEYLRTL
jgi:AraC-like DNA-binding protein